MKIERATGLVLRIRPLTDTSLIVQWLTRDTGRLATVARGARRPKSPFRGQMDLFYLADLSYAHSSRSELHQLREVRLLESHAALRDGPGLGATGLLLRGPHRANYGSGNAGAVGIRSILRLPCPAAQTAGPTANGLCL